MYIMQKCEKCFVFRVTFRIQTDSEPPDPENGEETEADHGRRQTKNKNKVCRGEKNY